MVHHYNTTGHSERVAHGSPLQHNRSQQRQPWNSDRLPVSTVIFSGFEFEFLVYDPINHVRFKLDHCPQM
jgi:hypothetical protein